MMANMGLWTMGESTAIGWTDHTFNPWMGCTKVSPGCDHCYAEALGKRTGRVEWGDDAERVTTSAAYWKNPAKWNAKAEAEGVRRRVFCASLADVFEDRADREEPRYRLWEVIEDTPWLDWQLLTKRPQNVIDMVPLDWFPGGMWPANCWVGTTVEDQERANERVPVLLGIPAPVRFLSCEPLLGTITLAPWLHEGIDWVIVGGESGGGYRPLDIEDARVIRDECIEAGVPFFFKQVGGLHPTSGGKELDGRLWTEFPAPGHIGGDAR